MSIQGNAYTRALVRPPGASFVDAIATIPQPIDVALAQQQHDAYVRALRTAGVAVDILAADERFPDSCFMQDPAMVVGGLAVLNRMGAESRRGETALVEDALRANFETRSLAAPATLEGGDVLNAGKRLLVGVTERTNEAGIAQLRKIVEPLGLEVEAVPVGEYLHLLTVVTYIGSNTIVVLEDFASNPHLSGFDKVIVPPEEAYAANTLGVGKYVILPECFPKTMQHLRDCGFEPLPVPMSEFYKADGGVSCLSLIW